jgi:sugar phosphate permease
MLALIVAGEAIFGLPFHVARFFRKTVLDVFGLTNTELGTAQAVYGVTAMLAYFPGGPIADLFSARKLLCVSLILTTAGGLYMATFPGLLGSMVVWGFFGFSTIIFFWAALIRATRDWGGTDEQGRAFGLLDGGRGLLAAILASLGVAVFAYVFPEGKEATLAQKEDALRIVIYGYAAATLAAAALVWFCVPDYDPELGGPLDRELGSASPVDATAHIGESSAHHVKLVLSMPLVWMQALIVLCAYVGFKGFDNFSLFAVEAYGMSEGDAAQYVSYTAWLRPVAALGAGLLADRIRSTRVMFIFFGILLASDLYFAFATPDSSATALMLANMMVASAAIFAMRGVYFALFKEATVPPSITGTAVGMVSVIGYTPDIFVSLLGGILLDRSPGVAGHQHFFMMMAAFSLVGLLVTMVFIRSCERGKNDD